MRIERLGGLGGAPRVLRTIAAAAERRGLPPPAALIGEWFGSGAVIAQSLAVSAVNPGDVFDVGLGAADAGAVGGGWFGYLSYPDAGAFGHAGFSQTFLHQVDIGPVIVEGDAVPVPGAFLDRQRVVGGGKGKLVIAVDRGLQAVCAAEMAEARHQHRVIGVNVRFLLDHPL